MCSEIKSMLGGG